jgi:hypothetical protein
MVQTSYLRLLRPIDAGSRSVLMWAYTGKEVVE